MASGNTVFSGHALQRMFERSISVLDVMQVLNHGESIAEYPDDEPFGSKLVLGFVEDRPLHVVAAEDLASGTTYIVTAYPPDPALWSPDFKTRRGQ